MFLRKWMKRREQAPKVEYDDTRWFNIAPMPDPFRNLSEEMTDKAFCGSLEEEHADDECYIKRR